jgi:hypothetical protein
VKYVIECHFRPVEASRHTELSPLRRSHAQVTNGILPRQIRSNYPHQREKEAKMWSFEQISANWIYLGGLALSLFEREIVGFVMINGMDCLILVLRTSCRAGNLLVLLYVMCFEILEFFEKCEWW